MDVGKARRADVANLLGLAFGVRVRFASPAVLNDGVYGK
jgi:hypothetical protein